MSGSSSRCSSALGLSKQYDADDEDEMNKNSAQFRRLSFEEMDQWLETKYENAQLEELAKLVADLENDLGELLHTVPEWYE